MKSPLLAVFATVLIQSTPSQAKSLFNSNIPAFDPPIKELEVILDPQKELMKNIACLDSKQS